MHHKMTITLDEGYRAMARDQTREAEAQAWCNGIMAADKLRFKDRLATVSKTDMRAVEDAIKVHLGLPR